MRISIHQIFFLFSLLASLQALGHVKAIDANLTQGEAEVLDAAFHFEETNDPAYIKKLESLIQQNGLENSTLPIIRSKVPVDVNSFPLYLTLLKSNSPKVQKSGILNSINTSPVINELDSNQLNTYNQAVSELTVSKGNYPLMVAIDNTNAIIEQRQQGIEIPVQTPVQINDTRTVKERVEHALQTAEDAKKQSGITISQERAAFLNDVNTYNITKNPEQLASIQQFFLNPPADYNPSRWIGTKLDVNADTIDLILTIAENNYADPRLMYNDTLGNIILHILQSDYLPNADATTLERFQTIVDNLADLSPSAVHGFTQRWAIKGQEQLANLPEPQAMLTPYQSGHIAQAQLSTEKPSTMIPDAVEVVNDSKTLNTSKVVEIQSESTSEAETPAGNGTPWLPIGIGAAAILAALVAAKLYRRGR